MTQWSTTRVTPDPDARMGPPVDWIVAPLQRIVLLVVSAYSPIVYVVVPFNVTVVPAAASRGPRSAADAVWMPSATSKVQPKRKATQLGREGGGVLRVILEDAGEQPVLVMAFKRRSRHPRRPR